VLKIRYGLAGAAKPRRGFKEASMNRKTKLSILALAAAAFALTTTVAVALAATSPAVITGAATNKGTSTAVLHGTVNPNGAASSYVFEWGLTSAYGSASQSRPAGHGSKGVSVQSGLEGLLPGTVYHYRLSAANGVGGASGADRSFRTKGHPPPGAATGTPAQVGLRAATVTGTVEPNDQATSYSFQYGLSETYGSQTSGATVPAGSAPVPVSAQLAGLAPGTVFHYRVLASHGTYVSYGADQVFVTLPLRQQRARVKAKTSPRRSRRRPHVFTTTGSVIGAPSLPSSARCQGSAAITFWLHKRRLAHRLVPVGPECAFAARAKVRHLPRAARGHHRLRLRVAIRFRGNDYLAAARAHLEHVLLLGGHRVRR
jgi:hypothetical protein